MPGVQMPCPIKRTGSQNWYYRSAVPVDLRPILAAMPKGSRPRGWGAAEIWISLGTPDANKAKEECAKATAEVEQVKAALRTTQASLSQEQAEDMARSLTHYQATALAGEAYRGWAGDDGRLRITVEHTPGEGFKRRPPEPITEGEAAAILKHWETVGATDTAGNLEKPLGAIADRQLRSKGYLRGVDPSSREMLLLAMWHGYRDAFQNRQRNAQGDYSPDPKAARFPPWKVAGVTFEQLVDGWKAERKPRTATVATYRTHITEFARFVGYDDATRVTTDDVQRWKEALLQSGRLAGKTINEKHLAALKSVLGWAKANRKITSNPAQGVIVTTKAPTRTRSKGFSDEEAVTILRASLKAADTLRAVSDHLKATRRWVPWLLCYSGARVAEVTQLRGEDIMEEEGVWTMRLTPEAGSIKTDHYRFVPLHPDIIEQGFLDFVKRSGKGPLFYEPTRQRKADPRKPPAQTVANKLAKWVRDVGVTDDRIAPNHAWRHRFATMCRRHGVSEGAEMVLKGHAAQGEGAKYGDWPADVLAPEIAKLPKMDLAVKRLKA